MRVANSLVLAGPAEDVGGRGHALLGGDVLVAPAEGVADADDHVDLVDPGGQGEGGRARAG